jgi:hypothetical protein
MNWLQESKSIVWFLPDKRKEDTLLDEEGLPKSMDSLPIASGLSFCPSVKGLCSLKLL